MECPTINQIAYPQMEPVGQLAPYLSGLNINDAVESFNELADMLLAPSNKPADQFYHKYNSNRFHSTYAPSSPAQSECDQTSYYFSSWPASSCSSTSVSPHHSSSSSGPASVASSLSGDENSCSSASSSRKRRRTREGGELRKKNATAAERYRRRLKGRDSDLIGKLEREQERNASLRRQLESKLSLYREFVGLLAQNTALQDAELARLGAASLENVLSSVSPSSQSAGCESEDDDCIRELREHQDRFHQILTTATTTTCHIQTLIPNDHHLHPSTAAAAVTATQTTPTILTSFAVQQEGFRCY